MTGVARAQSLGSADFARLDPAFGDPVHDAQACFRAILKATAHPGLITSTPLSLAVAPPAPMGRAMASFALTLCDIDTPIWFDPALGPAANYLTFHCGAPFATTMGDARFAFTVDAAGLPPLESFALGSDEYPERSTTLVIEVTGIAEGHGVRLHGPGIRDETRLAIPGLPMRFWTERLALAGLFPRGLDVIFVSGGRLAALPRSTQASL